MDTVRILLCHPSGGINFLGGIDGPLTYATQPFDATFGKKRTRKRPRLAAEDLADLVTRTTAASGQCVAPTFGCCCQTHVSESSTIRQCFTAFLRTGSRVAAPAIGWPSKRGCTDPLSACTYP
jgi:NGP1NT (NUC091) domain